MTSKPIVKVLKTIGSTCKWIIIIFCVSVIVSNVFLIKHGMEKILFYDLTDKNPQNASVYRMVRVLLIVSVMIVNVVCILGVVAARNKNLWMSASFALILALILMVQIFGTVCKVIITFTDSMIFDLFTNKWSIWILVCNTIIFLTATLFVFLLHYESISGMRKTILQTTIITSDRNLVDSNFCHILQGPPFP